MSATDADRGLQLPAVRIVPPGRPWHWLRLGWRDFTLSPMPSALHGFLVAAACLLLVGLAQNRLHLLSGVFSGLLLIAPVLLTGLYELSRVSARGELATLADALAAWRCACRPLVGLGAMLAVIGTFWVVVSAVLIALMVKAPITDLASFVRYVILSQGSNLFFVWTLLGGLLASLVFAGTVVSVPLILDRQVDLTTAILTSVQVVAANPITMALWAALIMLVTALGMATLLIGLVLAIPVLGHATWHAYVDLVDAAELPPRQRR